MWWRRLRAQSPEPSPSARQDHGRGLPDVLSGGGPLEPAFQVEITDVLDLHSFAPKDARTAVETYLEEAYAKGFATVRIVHGKGIGAQREMVRTILKRTGFVA